MNLSITACGISDADRLEEAAELEGVIEATKVLPDLPSDCRKKSRTGVVLGDRLDTVALKYDAALGRQHARTDRCAAWYDEVQTGFSQNEVGAVSLAGPD